MNKKQAIIIVTLLALIVCAGILATKANNPLYTLNDDSTIGEQVSTGDNVFAGARLDKEHATSVAIQSLKTLIDDVNTPSESKKEAAKKYDQLSIAAKNESRIEDQLKLKGFEEVVCFIDDVKAKVVVKSKSELTDNQRKDIKSVVMSVASINQVEIEAKQ